MTRTPLTKRGIRQNGTLARSRSLHAAVTSDVVAAIDQWIASQSNPKPNRADVVRLALNEWMSRQVSKAQEDRDNLDRHIDRLEGEVAHLKPAASGKPSPRRAWPCSVAGAPRVTSPAKNKREKADK